MLTDDLSVHIGQMARLYWDIDKLQWGLAMNQSTIDDNFISRCANSWELRRARQAYQIHHAAVKAAMKLRRN